MKKIDTLLLLLGVAAVLLAEPVSTFVSCPACRGARSLSLTPPNLGQHDGEIGVTPGKPFATHRWDVKHDRCPLCEGSGRREMYRTKVPPPKPEEREGLDICLACRWSGVNPCKKCVGTGVVPCPDCKSSSRGGKPGWIRSERRTGGSRSRHVKIDVQPCGNCGGVGKVSCPACFGKGATPCRTCKSAGGVPHREKR